MTRCLLALVLLPTLSAQFHVDPGRSPRLQTRGGGAGHLEAWVSIDERRAGWFVIDTGFRGVLLQRAHAAALGLQLQAAGSVGGVAWSVPASRAQAAYLDVGPLRLRRPEFLVPERFGLQGMGLLGGAMFRAGVVLYDAAGGTVEVYDPKAFVAPPVEWLPLRLIAGLPFVELQIEGRPVLLEIDTGGGEALLLCSPAVARLGLGERRPRRRKQLRGPFGAMPADLVRVRSLRLGSLDFAAVRTTLGRARRGWLASRDFDGLIGAPILRHLVLWFDYGRRRVGVMDRRLYLDLAQRACRGLPPLDLDRDPYGASRACGAPDTSDAQTYHRSWVPATTSGRHWLELRYPRAVQARACLLHGTASTRAIESLAWLDTRGRRHRLGLEEAQVDPAQAGLGRIRVPLPAGSKVAGIRIQVDCGRVGGTHIIDAVGLLDAQQETHWADVATADAWLESGACRPPAFDADREIEALATRLGGAEAEYLRRLQRSDAGAGERRRWTQQLHPLAGVQPDLGGADLAGLVRALRGVELLSLGEPSHGSREVWQLRHRLLRFAVRELGFRHLVLEANHVDCLRLDAAVAGRGDLRAALAELYPWYLKCEGLLATLEWMRDFNRKAGRQLLRVQGCDFQLSGAGVPRLERYLARAAPARVADLAALQPLRSRSLGPWMRVAPAAKAAAGEAIASLLAFFASARQDLVARSSAAAFAEHRQILRCLQQDHELRVAGWPAGRGLRDRFMAENIRALHRQAGGAGLLLALHNGHALRAKVEGAPLVGQILAQDFGARHYVAAILTGGGQVLARAVQGAAGRGAPRPYELGQVAAPYLEARLAEPGLPWFWLSLGQVPAELAPWIATLQKTRILGASYDPNSPHDLDLGIVPGRACDALIYLRRSTPLRLLTPK